MVTTGQAILAPAVCTHSAQAPDTQCGRKVFQQALGNDEDEAKNIKDNWDDEYERKGKDWSKSESKCIRKRKSEMNEKNIKERNLIFFHIRGTRRT